MNRFTEWKNWVKTPPGIACAAISAICAVLLCFQGWWTFAQPVPHTYHADFSGARWISTSPPGWTGYFRKKFYVTEQVQHAWISIAATDYYELFVNGTSLVLPQTTLKIYPQMSGSFVSGDQETQYDLTPYLLPGENCITIYVRRRMLDRDTNLLVKGMVSEGTHTQWIFSDPSWKAKTVPDDFVGQGSWTVPFSLDDTWPNAVVVDRPVPGSRAQPMAISPAVFEKPIQGAWIGTRDPSAKASYFRRDFHRGSNETWLELCSSGDFEVYLNGRLVTNTNLMSQIHGTQTAMPQILASLPPVNDAQLINLAPWLTWGTNRLEIRTENSAGENALQAEIVSVQRDGSLSTLSSDSSWQARGGGDSAAWAPARELAPYGAPPYGLVSKLSYPLPTATQEIGREIVHGIILCIFLVIFWGLTWLIFSSALARQLNISYSRALVLDALSQVPIILVLSVLWLLSCDIRIRPEIPYQPILFWLIIAGSFLLRFGLWRGHFRRQPAPLAVERFPATRRFIRGYGFGIALLAIVVMAFWVRVTGLATFSLDQDEIFMRNCVHGIVERGFPSTNYQGLLYRLTTYELVPWPEAVCAILSGWQDWSLRVPSLLYGTAVAGLLGLFGSRMFDRRTGLLAAVIYALLSWNIHWARHCFHLQQCQFSALLCMYTFYMAIRNGGGVDRRYFPLTCILFCTTYLTWEGSGFLLAAFTIAIVALYPTDWRWLRQFHFWTCFSFVAAVILIQLCDREITLAPYLGLGSGLSDISSPSLNFLNPTSDLLFYFTHLFFTESHILLLILMFLGIPFCWHHKATRYVLVMFFTLLGCYSGLLPIYSIRYSYFYQTLLVLGGCAVAIQLYDRVVALARSVDWPWIGIWARASVAGIILLVFMAGTETVLKIHRVTFNPQNPDFFSRQHDGYIEYKVPSDYVVAHLQPGDAVIGTLPHTYMHFSGKFSYGLNSLLLKRMYYARSQNPPGFVDRYSGTTSFRNMPELENAFFTHHRVWIMAAPLMAMQEGSDSITRNFLQGISRLVYEDSFSRIYLWDGGGDPNSLPTNQPAILASSAGAILNPKLYPSSQPTHQSTSSSSSTSGTASAESSSGTSSSSSSSGSTGSSTGAPTVTMASTAGPTAPATGGGGGGGSGATASGGSTSALTSGSLTGSSQLGGVPTSSGVRINPNPGSTGGSASTTSLSRVTSSNLSIGSTSTSHTGGIVSATTTTLRSGVPDQYVSGTSNRGSAPAGAGGGGGGGPVATANPSRMSTATLGVSSSSYSGGSTISSGGLGPQPVQPPSESPSATRNLVPNL